MINDDLLHTPVMASYYMDLIAEAIGLHPDVISDTHQRFHPGDHCWHNDMHEGVYRCCTCDARIDTATIHDFHKNFKFVYRRQNRDRP